MSKDLEVSCEQNGEVTRISIKGDVTAVTGAAIESAYSEINDERSKKILFCFDGENYINSGGIAILIGIAAAGKKKDQVLRMAGISDHFQKIFKMVGLTKYIEIFPSEETALQDF